MGKGRGRKPRRALEASKGLRGLVSEAVTPGRIRIDRVLKGAIPSGLLIAPGKRAGGACGARVTGTGVCGMRTTAGVGVPACAAPAAAPRWPNVFAGRNARAHAKSIPQIVRRRIAGRGAVDRIRSPFGLQERNRKAILVHPLNSDKKSLGRRHFAVGFTGLPCSGAYILR